MVEGQQEDEEAAEEQKEEQVETVTVEELKAENEKLKAQLLETTNSKEHLHGAREVDFDETTPEQMLLKEGPFEEFRASARYLLHRFHYRQKRHTAKLLFLALEKPAGEGLVGLSHFYSFLAGFRHRHVYFLVPTGSRLPNAMDFMWWQRNFRRGVWSGRFNRIFRRSRR